MVARKHPYLLKEKQSRHMTQESKRLASQREVLALGRSVRRPPEGKKKKNNYQKRESLQSIKCEYR